MPPRVLWSHPVTAPDDYPLPAGFERICRERELSSAFAKKYPRTGGLSEYLARLWLALRILKRRRRFDVIATGRYGELFALLQGLWPFGRRPLVLLDVEWYSAHSSPGKAALSRWAHCLMAKGAARIQVFCRVEAANYANRYGIPVERFVWIPYCASTERVTSSEDARERPERPVAFTGGLHHRDYKTLFGAIDGLALQLRVAAPAEALEKLAVPSNVRLLGVVPGAEYWRELNDCQFVVLSLQPHLSRCPGVITYVAAMARGKCVVVNEPAGAPDYIDNESTGFIVAPSDVAALRAQLLFLLGHPERMQAVGREAKIAAAERFSPAAYFRAVEAVTARLGSSGR